MNKPRAILIDIIPPQMRKPQAERRLFELESLVRTFGGIVVVKVVQKRSTPDYKTYIGRGKLEEIIETAKEKKANLLIINNLLKPKQMFAIEEILRKHNLKNWDRIDLILKIFQKHATTAEAKLQIKLAAINHMGPRIFDMGMELMKQVGGIGTRGGGETNTEKMKRHLKEQARQIKKKLQKSSLSRSEHRKRRERLGMKTASIVGYTNAGKSSLLNALTNKGAYVANELFATLDTRVAKLYLPPSPGPNPQSPVHSPQNFLLSDTIGFIQNLPPNLVSAFRSTLEETIEADLLLHVIDVSDPYIQNHVVEVEEILNQLGVGQTPKIYVFNKIDTVSKQHLDNIWARFMDYLKQSSTPDSVSRTPDHEAVFVSCITGHGLNNLKQKIQSFL
ncbi:MAG: GTPase HflX [Patescibacteria group bacterium]